MDTYINQDILSFLNIDSRVIVKRITQLWNSHIQNIGIKERKLEYTSDMLCVGCYDGSVRKINNGSNNWNKGFQSACRGGHREIIDLMIFKGAQNWDW